MYQLKTDLNCNNELRVTLAPIKNVGVSLRAQASEKLGAPESEIQEIRSTNPQKLSSLDIRSDFRTVRIDCNAHNHRRTKFGRYAQTRIIRAAGALDKLDSDPTHYLFLTATLPSDSDWAKWAIAEDAHHLIDGFKSWLSKRHKSRYEFYVWEHQRRQALHFHYCIHVPDPHVREGIMRDFRGEWIRLLEGMEKRTGISAWGKHAALDYEHKYEILQTKAEIVYSSVSQYMAGYCSNGKNKHSKDDYIPYYPKRWFGVSRGLSALIREHSESESEIHSSYRTAKIAFDELTHQFSDDSLTSKIFKHKFGVGETSVHYHTPENLHQLWLLRKAMKYNQKSHPQLSSWIQTALSITRMCLELETNSQIFRELSCKLPIDSLKDGLYAGSLQRGSLRRCQVEAIESLWSVLASQSNLPRTLKPLLTAASRFIRRHSENYHLIRYNQHGWLDMIEDFPSTVDISEQKRQTGTRFDDDGAPSGPDSSRGHVPSEPKPSVCQMNLL